MSITPAQLQARLNAMKSRLALLDRFLANPVVEEIAVNRLGEVSLWGGNKWTRVFVPELDYDWLNRLASDTANFVGLPFDRKHTTLSAYLPTGERVNIVCAPTARDFFLNVRKHVGSAYSHDYLADSGYYRITRHQHAMSMTAEKRKFYLSQLTNQECNLWELASAGMWREFMQNAVAHKQNIVVSGSTGAGKTAYLRALIGLIPQTQRIITVEDTLEMPLYDTSRPDHGHAHSAAMLYRRESDTGEGASIDEVMAAVMRMTPSQVILAELRGPEAFFFINGVLNSGHPGGMTTVHCTRPRDAFDRIALLIKASPTGQGIDMPTITANLYKTINIVVQIEASDEGRFVPSIFYDPVYAASLRA